jgi:hypothetical protein
VHLTGVLLDNRVECTFLDSKEAKNVIFCRPLEESLHNVATLQTRNEEFIHNFITESTGNYLVTDVTLSDGSTYKNVRFKLVESTEEELPCSTINLSALGVPSTFTEIVRPTVLQPTILNESSDKVEKKEVYVENKFVSTDSTKDVFEARILEQRLNNEKIRLEEERQQLVVEQTRLNADRKLQKTLEDYKSELLHEYYLIGEKQKELLSSELLDSVGSIGNTLQEQFNKQQEQASLYLNEVASANLKELKESQNRKINEIKKELNDLLNEKVENNSFAVDKRFIERSAELKTLFSEKLITELEAYKQKIIKEVSGITFSIDRLIDEKIEANTDNLDKLLITRAGEIQDQFDTKLSEVKSSTITEAKEISRNSTNLFFTEKAEELSVMLKEHEDAITSTANDKVSELVKAINEQKNNLDNIILNKTEELNTLVQEFNLKIDNKNIDADSKLKSIKEAVDAIINEYKESFNSHLLNAKDVIFEDHNTFKTSTEVLINEQNNIIESKANSAVDLIKATATEQKAFIDSQISIIESKINNATDSIETISKNTTSKIPLLEDKIQEVETIILDHKENLNTLVFQGITDLKKIILEFTNETQSRIPGLDEKIQKINEYISTLLTEKIAVKKLVEENKQYTDKKITAATQDAKEYARRILELGGGGGSVAVQYANGGTMNGTLNVTGQYLSGGKDLATIFSGSTPYILVDATSSIQPVRGRNIASGCYSNIGGGQYNIASGCYSTITGGLSGVADWNYTTVGGGICNTASLYYSVVAGGANNCAVNVATTIGGGLNNCANGAVATVAGGEYNSASGDYAFIGGGTCNCTLGCNSVIAGGITNCATGNCSFIGSGDTNCAANTNDVVAGGNHNCSSGGASFVGGGRLNFSSSQYTTVAGGNQNCSIAYAAAVVGGQSNIASGAYSFVGGGGSNCVLTDSGFIGGGCHNRVTTSGDYGVGLIGGGVNNCVNGDHAAVVAGDSNRALGQNSFVGGGGANTASESESVVVGGFCNTASGYRSFVGGGGANTASESESVVVGGFCNTASGYRSFVGAGRSNCIDSVIDSSVIGGFNNSVFGDSSIIGGGCYNTIGINPSIRNGGQAFWNLNESSGNRLETIGIGGNTLYQHNTVPSTVGINKNGIIGNGSGWLETTNTSNFAGDFTINYWTIPNTNGTVQQFSGEGSVGLNFNVTNTKIYYGIPNVNVYLTYSPPGGISTSKWSMATLTRTDGTVNMYLNGVLVGTNVDSNNYSSVIALLALPGGAYVGNSTGAKIDEVSVWSGAGLTQDQITALYKVNPYLSYPFSISNGNIGGGNNNSIFSNNSFVAGGSANIAGYDNTFILGSNITASQPNYTYVNNLSSQGLIADQTGTSNNWNTIYNYTSANFAAIAPSYYMVDTTTQGVTATLPSVTQKGLVVGFMDPYKTWDTNNFVLSASILIEGQNQPVFMNLAGFAIKAVYVGGNQGWKLTQ